MNCSRFANVMNNTTISSSFNSDNSNIANSKTQHRQIITTITYRILKFEPLIKKPIVTNYTFCTVITTASINSSLKSVLLQYSIYKTYLLKTNLHQFQEDFLQNNLSFDFLQFYKHNCQTYILQEAIEMTVKKAFIHSYIHIHHRKLV